MLANPNLSLPIHFFFCFACILDAQNAVFGVNSVPKFPLAVFDVPGGDVSVDDILVVEVDESSQGLLGDVPSPLRACLLKGLPKVDVLESVEGRGVHFL
ncbi:hypothetical protein L596_007905 [Steinernema carpocapsae]|uniref:Secreted protein n=1 Tax=Steinernema carpocapsae TaxID=34508 RepID=A0A4U5PAT1_STECR|nr:hypothetical protein L596_007905 [Steinernema carpocapsae]